MEPTLEQLKHVADAVRAKLRAMSEDKVRETLVMADYHGFAKARFPESFLAEVVKPHNLKPQDVQLEVVHVGCDLTNEIHLHREATAIAVCLGPEEHFPAPKFAQGFLTDHWFDVSVGDVVDIPAGTPHGFTVSEGGTLTFLSVQSPPIVREDGHDDYVRLK